MATGRKNPCTRGHPTQGHGYGREPLPTGTGVGIELCPTSICRRARKEYARTRKPAKPALTCGATLEEYITSASRVSLHSSQIPQSRSHRHPHPRDPCHALPCRGLHATRGLTMLLHASTHPRDRCHSSSCCECGSSAYGARLP
jgi:hypothetical protein